MLVDGGFSAVYTIPPNISTDGFTTLFNNKSANILTVSAVSLCPADIRPRKGHGFGPMAVVETRRKDHMLAQIKEGYLAGE